VEKNEGLTKLLLTCEKRLRYNGEKNGRCAYISSCATCVMFVFFSNLFAAPFGVVPLAISLSASVLVNGRQRGE
jgi:hypothetical protein